MSSYKTCEACGEKQRDVCKAEPAKKLECIRSETQPGRFCDCVNEKQKAVLCTLCKEVCQQRLRRTQNFELTRFESSFEYEDEQRCAVAGYLWNEHRINSNAMIKDFTTKEPDGRLLLKRCRRTGEYAVQVYLRFRSYFTEKERDIIVGEWKRKYGWRIQAGKSESSS